MENEMNIVLFGNTGYLGFSGNGKHTCKSSKGGSEYVKIGRKQGDQRRETDIVFSL